MARIAVGILVAAAVVWAGIKLTHKSSLPDIVSPLRVRIYTNNIRMDNRGQLDNEERRWAERRPHISSSIVFNTDTGNANVVCLQEVLHNQLLDVVGNLNHDEDAWKFYGVGRTDGRHLGEYAPILFKDAEWTLLDNKTFWLSETPDVPSKGWDAALERIVTFVTLQSKANPRVKLNFLNTHFDHIGHEARRESSKLIISKMEGYNEHPSFLCGDFNTQPQDEPYQILKGHGYKDSRALIDDLHSYGHNTTFSGFNSKNEVNTIIDYVWAPYFSRNGNVQSEPEDKKLTYQIAIKAFGILHNHFGIYMSDHRPVVADYEVIRNWW